MHCIHELHCMLMVQFRSALGTALRVSGQVCILLSTRIPTIYYSVYALALLLNGAGSCGLIYVHLPSINQSSLCLPTAKTSDDVAPRRFNRAAITPWFCKWCSRPALLRQHDVQVSQGSRAGRATVQNGYLSPSYCTGAPIPRNSLSAVHLRRKILPLPYAYPTDPAPLTV
jgi:hypothetical protein